MATVLVCRAYYLLYYNLTLFKSAPLGGQVHVPYINVCAPQECMFPMILTAT